MAAFIDNGMLQVAQYLSPQLNPINDLFMPMLSIGQIFNSKTRNCWNMITLSMLDTQTVYYYSDRSIPRLEIFTSEEATGYPNHNWHDEPRLKLSETASISQVINFRVAVPNTTERYDLSIVRNNDPLFDRGLDFLEFFRLFGGKAFHLETEQFKNEYGTWFGFKKPKLVGVA